MWIRTLIVVLVLAALGATAAGVVTGVSSHQVVASGNTSTVAATPVLSARRVPSLLARPTARRRLAAAVAPVLARANGTHCFAALDASGQPLVDDSASSSLMPGSNLKLATAFAALRELGPDTTLSTKIVATSPPEEGTINGDLYVVGGGDPLIVTDNYLATSKYGAYPHTSLAAISDAITAAGITRISGSIRGDDSRYDALRSVPSWPDRYLAEAQVGPLSALSLNDARTYPVGTFDSGIPRPAADPSAYGAIGLTEQLRARGIAVEGMPGSGVAPANGTVVTDVPSLPVQQIVSEMLTFSDNNTAELLLKELGRHRAGQGSTAAGLDVVRDVLTKAGLGVDGFDPHDGSGLDRGDRATCSLLAALVAKDGTDGQIATGMAVAGRTGTLRDRFRSSQAAGEVRAKTGTLNDVTALSGWVHTTKDADVAFSYLLNTDGRRVGPDDLTLQEQLTEALRSYPDSPDLASLGPKPPVDR